MDKLPIPLDENSPPARKSLLIRFGGTIGYLSFCIPFVSYALILGLTNPAPKELELIHVSGVIVNASQNHPNFDVKLADHSILHVDFPVNLYLLGSPRFYGIDGKVLVGLVGSTVEMDVAPLKYSLTDQIRVWSFHSKKMTYTYSQAVGYYQEHGSFNGITIAEQLIFILVLMTIFLFEKRNAP